MDSIMHCDCGVDMDEDHDSDCLVGAIHGIAHNLERLGNNNAGTSMGAIEGLGLAITNAADVVAAGMSEIANSEKVDS